MSDMADALSSASLLLAALALVYSVWSGSIDGEEKRVFSVNAETKIKEKTQVRSVRNRRAVPLAIGSWLIVAAFGPRVFDIIAATATGMTQGDWCYDDVATVFLLTVVFVLVLAFHLTGRVCALNKKLRS